MKTPACVHLLKALADPTRWRIVSELIAAPRSAGELVVRLGATQYNVSKHIRILREAGIVESERKGRCVECRILPAFRLRLRGNRNRLDLGCCVFRFDSPEK